MPRKFICFFFRKYNVFIISNQYFNQTQICFKMNTNFDRNFLHILSTFFLHLKQFIRFWNISFEKILNLNDVCIINKSFCEIIFVFFSIMCFFHRAKNKKFSIIACWKFDKSIETVNASTQIWCHSHRKIVTKKKTKYFRCTVHVRIRNNCVIWRFVVINTRIVVDERMFERSAIFD